MFPFFQDLPVKYPATIPLGTDIYGLDGSPWAAPATLHLVAIRDNPTGNTLIPALDDILGKSPVAVYAEEPASEDMTPDLPASVDPETYPPDVPDNPFFYLPSDWGIYSDPVGFNGPLSEIDLTWFAYAYSGCDHPQTWHVLQNIDDHDFIGFRVSGAPFWRGSTVYGHETCNKDKNVGAFFFDVQIYGAYSAVMVHYPHPLDDDPVIWFHPDLFAPVGPLGESDPGLAGISLAATALLLIFVNSSPLLENFRIGLDQLYGVAGETYPLASEDKAVVVTT